MEVELRWRPRPSSLGDGTFSARIPEGSPGRGVGGVVSSPVLPTRGLGRRPRKGGQAGWLGLYFWSTDRVPCSAQGTGTQQLISLLKQPLQWVSVRVPFYRWAH